MGVTFLIRYALVVFEIWIGIATVIFALDSAYAAVSVVVMFVVLAVLFETRELVLENRLSWSSIRVLAYMLVPVMLINYVLSEPAPRWFPTNSSAWILVPFILFGAASLRWMNGWGSKKK